MRTLRWEGLIVRWPWAVAGLLAVPTAVLSLHGRSSPAPAAWQTSRPADRVISSAGTQQCTWEDDAQDAFLAPGQPRRITHLPARALQVSANEPEPAAPRGRVRELIPVPAVPPMQPELANPRDTQLAWPELAAPQVDTGPQHRWAAPVREDYHGLELSGPRGYAPDEAVGLERLPAVTPAPPAEPQFTPMPAPTRVDPYNNQGTFPLDREELPLELDLDAGEPSGKHLPADRTASTSPRPMPAEPVTADQIIRALPESSRQALREQVERRLATGFDLADRHAFYSAKREFETALRMVADAIDGQLGQTTHADALAQALRAIEEADDFFVDDPRASGQIELSNIVVTHRTEILKEGRAEGLSPLQAMQAYYAHAQQLFLESLRGEPYAAQALYGLGKTYLVLAQDQQGHARLAGPKSLLMHQLAVTLDPQHVLAANELGVLLARYGQLDEAKQVLQATEIARRTPEVWHNLAVVHERLGEGEWAVSAREHFVAAEQLRRQRSFAQAVVSQDGTVQWVDVQSLGQGVPQTAQAAPSTPPSDERQAKSFSWPWSSSQR